MDTWLLARCAGSKSRGPWAWVCKCFPHKTLRNTKAQLHRLYPFPLDLSFLAHRAFSHRPFTTICCFKYNTTFYITVYQHQLAVYSHLGPAARPSSLQHSSVACGLNRIDWRAEGLVAQQKYNSSALPARLSWAFTTRSSHGGRGPPAEKSAAAA